jgi:cytidylate kinase
LRTTITIARQMGSGGSYVGQLIAKQLGIKYVDREVIHLAAQEFGCDEETVAARTERLTSFWERIFSGLTFGPPETSYAPPPLRTFSDKELFDKQIEIVRAIATDSDCIIVGWGGCHVIPSHRGKISIFCHAPLKFRVKRVMEIYHSRSEDDARRMILESDEMRKRYIFEMTGKDWACAENYHFSINTSLLPLSKIAEFIVELLRSKGIVRED